MPPSDWHGPCRPVTTGCDKNGHRQPELALFTGCKRAGCHLLWRAVPAAKPVFYMILQVVQLRVFVAF